MIPDLKIFAGGLLMSPIPLELSFSRCSFGCSYCFANLNTPRRRGNPSQLINFLAAYRRRDTLESHLLQAGYPVCVSNTTDMFADSNYGAALPIVEILGILGIPVQIQTKGTARADWLQEMLARIDLQAVWYVTVNTLDDAIRARIEPGAPSISSRLGMIERVRAAGHRVVVGINPAVAEWCQDAGRLVRGLAEAGAEGFWIERLHLTWAQIRNMGTTARAGIGDEVLRRAQKRKLEACDSDLIAAIRAAARAEGLPCYSFHQPVASHFFEIYHTTYARTFPTHQDLVNHCHENNPRALSFDDYRALLLPRLPAGTYAADQYIGATSRNLYRHCEVPAELSYEQILDLAWRWHQVKFAPVRIPCFAWASEGESRLVDSTGRPFLLFNAAGFDEMYAEVA